MFDAATASVWWRVAAVSGASAVLLGAFGAHGLRNRVADVKLLTTWETGAHYHLIHSVALGMAALARRDTAAACFTAGMLLFSGSLYALVMSGKRALGAITPIGGLLLTAGWVALVPWQAATAGSRSGADGSHPHSL